MRAVLFFLCLCCAAHAQQGAVISADNSGWKQVVQKDGVTVYSRGRPGTSLKEFKGVGSIAATPQTIENVLQDVPNYTRFMPYISEARVISKAGDATVVYQRLSAPLVSDRDYTVRVAHGTETTPGGLAYLDTWQAANGTGPAERHGVVRVKINDGSWLLEPAGPNSTQATYRFYTDCGGALPAFVSNHVSQAAIPRIFAAIRKQMQDPKYAAAPAQASTPAPAASPAQ